MQRLGLVPKLAALLCAIEAQEFVLGVGYAVVSVDLEGLKEFVH